MGTEEHLRLGNHLHLVTLMIILTLLSLTVMLASIYILEVFHYVLQARQSQPPQTVIISPSSPLLPFPLPTPPPPPPSLPPPSLLKIN